MYLIPLVATLISSVFCGALPIVSRSIGCRGVAIFSIMSLSIAFISSALIWIDIYNGSSPVWIELFGSWIEVGSVVVTWDVYIDLMTANMLFTVTSVSLAVHMYAVVYMRNDPHLSLFMSYLSLFTFFMLVYVSGSNLLVMLVGWEGIGVCSYLLIGYYSHRLAAVKSAQKAILVNRVSDGMLLWGVIWIWYYSGTLEYDLALLNPTTNISMFLVISVLIGAMGKSAQILFHVWLADAMEGERGVKYGVIVKLIVVLCIEYLLIENVNEEEATLLVDKTLLICGFFTNSKVKCSNYQMEAITGLMLSDGHLRNPNASRRPTGNNRLELTFKEPVLDFVKWLKFEVLKGLSTPTAPTPHPKEQPKQNWYSTQCLPMFTELALVYYSEVNNKRVKLMPTDDYLDRNFTEEALAFMIMGDGYWDTDRATIMLCTENYKPEETIRFALFLETKFGLICTFRKRELKVGFGYRIGFSRLSVDKIRTLVLDHMHPLMLYKLGIKT